jgi:hypothetical protein
MNVQLGCRRRSVGEPGLSRPQAARRRGVPRDVAVAEDEQVGVRVRSRGAGLPSRPAARLVHHRDPHAGQRLPGDLGQPLPELGAVVVAPAGQQPPRALLQPVQQRRRHPVTGVHHDVGRLHLGPHLRRQVLGPRREVGVGEQQQAHRPSLPRRCVRGSSCRDVAISRARRACVIAPSRRPGRRARARGSGRGDLGACRASVIAPSRRPGRRARAVQQTWRSRGPAERPVIATSRRPGRRAGLAGRTWRSRGPAERPVIATSRRPGRRAGARGQDVAISGACRASVIAPSRRPGRRARLAGRTWRSRGPAERP